MRDIINKIEAASNVAETFVLNEEDAADLAAATYTKVGSIGITADTTDAEIDALVNQLVSSLWSN
jgi:uncharacterized protein YaiI (UPF0178 family)